jgi:drug/metabolite transporter (DMT)-like permease
MVVFKIQQWRERRDDPYGAKQDGRKKYPPIVFLLPALCDMLGTSLMYVGLTLTYASVFQMLRGSVVIFTGILSVIFLKRKLYNIHWLGMFLVLSGLGCVGVASIVMGGTSKNAPNPLLGDIFVIAAQIVVSIQMVVEEKFVAKYDVHPLEGVGWEGAFGFCLMSLVLFIMYFIPGVSGGNHLESTPDAVLQLGKNPVILLATLGNIVSIAFFNFFGLSVTKTMSATTRMVLDSVRTFVIWGVTLLVGWQEFQYLQVVGFALLLLGTCVYNKIIPVPCFAPPHEEEATEKLNQPTGDEYPSATGDSA